MVNYVPAQGYPSNPYKIVTDTFIWVLCCLTRIIARQLHNGIGTHFFSHRDNKLMH